MLICFLFDMHGCLFEEYCLDVRLTFGLFFSIIQTHFLLPRAQLFNDNWQFVIGVGNVVAMPITCHMNVMFENSLAPHVRFSGLMIFFWKIATTLAQTLYLSRVSGAALG